ncbi:malate dehydrogenase [Rhodococcus pseudokoreensis]|uniref:Malate dehydrogenase n=1 Tax=Rhodococcus pseudokoreensis TaxID=2811421 RepID=A0A974W467_9NOCA|nr:malate dehydrogenase [Rhodococcus pseudokoreensis]QSE90679.1 malate dehydrogenase [Rhodococcus pseudokoreensis]
MTVFGVDAVEAATESTGAELIVGPKDIVTPLARERARERGVTIVVGKSRPADGFPTPPAVPNGPAPAQAHRAPAVDSAFRRPQSNGFQAPPPPLRPPAPALYRRGAPLHPTVAPAVLRHPHASSPARPVNTKSVHRVVVVGAGHVGMITAMKLAEANIIEEVVLVDIADGLAAGIALDLTHSTALLGFDTKVRGVTQVADAGVADYVVITAGRARQPGMSRTDLVEVNAGIVGGLAREAAAVSPGTVLLIVTNPLDEMTHHAWQASGLPAERVIGMAGVLDSSRFQALTGLAARSAPSDVSALALGSHGDEMVIPLSQARVAGKAIDQALPQGEVTALVDRARNSGAEVVGLLKSGSAFFAPGASAARMVLAMATDSGEVIAATVHARGEYGIREGYVGLPAKLGRGGLREIVELPLAEDELAAVRTAATRISERVADLQQVTAAS